MHARTWLAIVGVAAVGAAGAGQAQKKHLNPMIELHIQKKPIFGLYAPANPRGRGNRGTAGTTAPATPPPSPTALKTPAGLAKDALAYDKSDFIFDGGMERGLDPAIGNFSELVKGIASATAPEVRWRYPLSVKTPRIAPDSARAIENISRQLNLGATTIVMVDVESADEVKQGIAAMRFKSKGGTRPDDVGGAPAYWGMSEREYREKADPWPLNPNGELTSWAIVESREGLANVREIAAVKGLTVLFPGAGTLRGVFRTPGADGQSAFDAAAWEAAIQQVLAACREFDVACGYPATEADIETRLKQGFSVFIMGWGEPGFRAIDIGRKAAGR